MIWKTIGVVDNQNMNVPHALQQSHIHQEDVGLVPQENHRLVSINELDGV